MSILSLILVLLGIPAVLYIICLTLCVVVAAFWSINRFQQQAQLKRI